MKSHTVWYVHIKRAQIYAEVIVLLDKLVKGYEMRYIQVITYLTVVSSGMDQMHAWTWY